MSNPILTRTRSRLSSVALAGGGITMREAVNRADAALELVRGEMFTVLSAIVDRLDALFGGAAAGDEPSMELLYEMASSVIDTAIGLPGSDIDLAARSLCDVADAATETGFVDWPAIKIHVETLKLLRTHGPGLPVAERAKLIEGLAKVRRRQKPASEIS